MKKIKVLEVVPNMQQGGLENLVMNIFRVIDKEKFEVHFLYHYCDSFYFDEEIKKMGGIIHKCSFRNDHNLIRYIKYLNSFFKENKFDVVHSHMLSTSFFTMHFAKKYGTNILINHAHNTTTENTIKGVMKSLMIKLSSNDANMFLACSYESGKFAYSNKKFIVINNCIDLNRFSFSEKKRKEYRNKLGIEENEKLFGNIGRLNIQKNQLFLLDVFSKTKSNNKLIIIGYGELKNKIIEKIKKLNLEKRVILLENISNTEDYYCAMDYFVLPSIFEGFPLTAVEAQANKLPCIFSSKVDKNVSLSDNNVFIDLVEQKWINVINENKFERSKTTSDDLKKYDILYLKGLIENIYEGVALNEIENK